MGSLCPHGGMLLSLLPEQCAQPVSLLSPVQYEVSGEEHLYSDFPEIDLSQLDAGDLDSAGCFSELQWGGEHSETDSSQYSTDDSELFQVPPSPPARRQGGEGEGRWEEGTHTQLLISPPQLISAPLICAPALNGASGVGLMRRRRRRRRMLSQPSCAGLFTGNCSVSCSIPGMPGRHCGGLSPGRIPSPGAQSSPCLCFGETKQALAAPSVCGAGSSPQLWAGSMAVAARCKAGTGLLHIPLLPSLVSSPAGLWAQHRQVGSRERKRGLGTEQAGQTLTLPKAPAMPWVCLSLGLGVSVPS